MSQFNSHLRYSQAINSNVQLSGAAAVPRFTKWGSLVANIRSQTDGQT